MSTEQPSITCPKCGMTSYHPHDIEEGYCGKCHDWTAPPYGIVWPFIDGSPRTQ